MVVPAARRKRVLSSDPAGRIRYGGSFADSAVLSTLATIHHTAHGSDSRPSRLARRHLEANCKPVAQTMFHYGVRQDLRGTAELVVIERGHHIPRAGAGDDVPGRAGLFAQLGAQPGNIHTQQVRFALIAGAPYLEQ